MPCPFVSQFCFRRRIALVGTALPMPIADAALILAVFGVGGVELTFDRAVVVVGFPMSWVIEGGAADGLSPVGVTISSPTVLTIIIAGDATAATGLRMTPYDPAIRTVSGGFASPDAFRN